MILLPAFYLFICHPTTCSTPSMQLLFLDVADAIRPICSLRQFGVSLLWDVHRHNEVHIACFNRVFQGGVFDMRSSSHPCKKSGHNR
ncbi:hypothetical protein BKA67DRAFT_573378 [Truncatella angustata]|uniref:Secreted protein n=1 Tax=Truncatella angustata TaxID=152316 RepID=A0A9P8UHH5_9PEZI|nr:uncharacterized protein BKA67DRAFT_573378 [Truncatella angustata]KAH6652236.1 hypothetical protein BKA67DRAFT_573378 [Truncatella angustata]